MGLHDSNNDSKSSAGIPIPPSKPKIWSLADTAVCKTPPPSAGGGAVGPGGGGQSHHTPVSHHQQQAHYQQPPPPNSQSYLHSGLGGSNPAAAASLTPWGPNFSQFGADPATQMMRLRQSNMLGMGYMGLPPPPGGVSQQSFTPLTPSAAAMAAAAHVTASPGLNSDGVQSSSNDTPPQTPPNVKNQFGYNGNLHNGYSQMSPSSGAIVTSMASSAGSGMNAMAEAASVASSKLLMFNSPAAMNTASSFKMMWGASRKIRPVCQPASKQHFSVCVLRGQEEEEKEKKTSWLSCSSAVLERKEKQTLRNCMILWDEGALPPSRESFSLFFKILPFHGEKIQWKKNNITIIIIMKKQQPTNPHQYLKFNNRTECHIHHQAKGVSVFVSFFVL